MTHLTLRQLRTSDICGPSSTISWLTAAAGLWALIAPTAMNYTGAVASRGNDIVVGIIVLALGIANALYRQSPVRTRA